MGHPAKSTAKMVVVKYSKYNSRILLVHSCPALTSRPYRALAFATFTAIATAACLAPMALAQPAVAGQGDRALFTDEPPEERGWKGLARLLEALEPAVDTSIPLTPSQITDRISLMLDQGRAAEALEIIEKRKAQYAGNPDPLGNDVQLMFLNARALAALGRHEAAIETYRDMTAKYPELPEPWNNLAAEYVKTGRLEMARQALDMALQANPEYRDARANLGRVQLMLAEESFRAAGVNVR